MAFTEGKPSSMLIDPLEPKLKEECGIFGIWGVERASETVSMGLHALQHRGQEGAGIASFDGRFHNRRRRGLVGEHFSRDDLSHVLPGRSAIGHVRYSTTGKPADRNLQPLFADIESEGIAIAHNGNLVNARAIRRDLVAKGALFQSDSDTEVVLHLLAVSARRTLAERFCDAIDQVVGGYALIALNNKALYAARDPIGIRPLSIGRLNNAYVVASETTALDLVGAKLVRDVEPGEVIMLNDEGLHIVRPGNGKPARLCAFEYIYFARPDSVINGMSVHRARSNMGRILARENAIEADIVVPVPDSGMPAAMGYSAGSGIPIDLGIIRSHFVGRTFIQPGQDKRDLKVRMKHTANASVLRGKRVVLVDDSIVRGTTSQAIVRMVREAGASAVHFLSACPPIRFPDFYGIDMPTREELLSARLVDPRAASSSLDADSVGFLSLEGLYEAVIGAERNPNAPQLTDHYFTGEYPTELLDRELGLLGKEAGASLLEPEAA
jgi:amidophosphoribosyltransferase